MTSMVSWLWSVAVYIPIWTIKDGQRRYNCFHAVRVYIPIWTIKDDLVQIALRGFEVVCLHSNMDD